MIEFVTQYPLAVGGILLVVMLGGILLGFFFRRHAAEETAKEILATPQFSDAAHAERIKGYRDQLFPETVARSIRCDTEVQSEIVKVLANSRPFYDLVDDRIEHRRRARADADRAELDLRFERVKAEIVGEVNKSFSASSTAIFKRFDDLAKRIDERVDNIVDGKKPG